MSAIEAGSSDFISVLKSVQCEKKHGYIYYNAVQNRYKLLQSKTLDSNDGYKLLNLKEITLLSKNVAKEVKDDSALRIKATLQYFADRRVEHLKEECSVVKGLKTTWEKVCNFFSKLGWMTASELTINVSHLFIVQTEQKINSPAPDQKEEVDPPLSDDEGQLSGDDGEKRAVKSEEGRRSTSSASSHSDSVRHLVRPSSNPKIDDGKPSSRIGSEDESDELGDFKVNPQPESNSSNVANAETSLPLGEIKERGATGSVVEQEPKDNLSPRNTGSSSSSETNGSRLNVNPSSSEERERTETPTSSREDKRDGVSPRDSRSSSGSQSGGSNIKDNLSGSEEVDPKMVQPRISVDEEKDESSKSSKSSRSSSHHSQGEELMGSEREDEPAKLPTDEVVPNPGEVDNTTLEALERALLEHDQHAARTASRGSNGEGDPVAIVRELSIEPLGADHNALYDTTDNLIHELLAAQPQKNGPPDDAMKAFVKPNEIQEPLSAITFPVHPALQHAKTEPNLGYRSHINPAERRDPPPLQKEIGVKRGSVRGSTKEWEVYRKSQSTTADEFSSKAETLMVKNMHDPAVAKEVVNLLKTYDGAVNVFKGILLKKQQAPNSQIFYQFFDGFEAKNRIGKNEVEIDNRTVAEMLKLYHELRVNKLINPGDTEPLLPCSAQRVFNAMTALMTDGAYKELMQVTTLGILEEFLTDESYNFEMFKGWLSIYLINEGKRTTDIGKTECKIINLLFNNLRNKNEFLDKLSTSKRQDEWDLHMYLLLWLLNAEEASTVGSKSITFLNEPFEGWKREDYSHPLNRWLKGYLEVSGKELKGVDFSSITNEKEFQAKVAFVLAHACLKNYDPNVSTALHFSHPRILNCVTLILDSPSLQKLEDPLLSLVEDFLTKGRQGFCIFEVICNILDYQERNFKQNNKLRPFMSKFLTKYKTDFRFTSWKSRVTSADTHLYHFLKNIK